MPKRNLRRSSPARRPSYLKCFHRATAIDQGAGEHHAVGDIVRLGVGCAPQPFDAALELAHAALDQAHEVLERGRLRLCRKPFLRQPSRPFEIAALEGGYRIAITNFHVVRLKGRRRSGQSRSLELSWPGS